MKITRKFCPGDRYTYDFGLCSNEKGLAQVDTAQQLSSTQVFYRPSWSDSASLQQGW